MTTPTCKIIELGLVDYERADRFQRELVTNRQYNETVDTLVLAEFFPVYTIGRNGTFEHILSDTTDGDETEDVIDIFDVDRGGEVTYHGPGQLVIYPIVDMRSYAEDITAFISKLENVVIHLCRGLGLTAHCKRDVRGVWIAEKQIASVGIGVNEWISYHGIALNIDADLSYFDVILSMNAPEGVRGNLSEFLDKKLTIDEAKKKIAVHFAEVFDCAITTTETVSALA